jgi:hypothetical protein
VPEAALLLASAGALFGNHLVATAVIVVVTMLLLFLLLWLVIFLIWCLLGGA